MIKLFALFFIFFVISRSQAEENVTDPPADPKCDKIFLQMLDGCISMRESMLNMTSKVPSELCCANLRYTICVRSLKTVSVVPKTTRICPEQFYDSRIDDLDNNSTLSEVKSICDTYDSQKCITDPVNAVLSGAKDRLDIAIGVLGNLADTVRNSIRRENKTET